VNLCIVTDADVYCATSTGVQHGIDCSTQQTHAVDKSVYGKHMQENLHSE